MKLFKTVDEKLAEIGFVKEEEDKYGCVYISTHYLTQR